MRFPRTELHQNPAVKKKKKVGTQKVSTNRASPFAIAPVEFQIDRSVEYDETQLSQPRQQQAQRQCRREVLKQHLKPNEHVETYR